MSVIVAIKKDGIVYVGTDSQVTYGSTKAILKTPNNYKIWTPFNSEHCIMGSVGFFRDACAVRVDPDIVSYEGIPMGEMTYAYVVNQVEPKIRECLIKHKFLSDSNPYENFGSSFLLAYEDKLYVIEGGCVMEYDDYCVIGSGESEAVGSLETTSKDPDLSPQERIIRAIQASAGHDLFVGAPIVLADTMYCDFQTVSGEKDIKKYLELVKKQKEDIEESWKIEDLVQEAAEKAVKDYLDSKKEATKKTKKASTTPKASKKKAPNVSSDTTIEIERDI